VAGQDSSLRFRFNILRLLDLHPDTTITLRWTPGHQDVCGNERADSVAKAAARSPSHDSHHTLTNASRSAKAISLQEWKDHWAANRITHPSSGFKPANNTPPTPRPPNHFFALNRRTFGLVTQCRTNHAFIGHYYSRFVPSEPVECPCGFHTQTRVHVIAHCPLHDRYRHILHAVTFNLDLTTLLGTEEGITALAKFIDKSGAFKKVGFMDAEPRDEPPGPDD